MRRFLAGFLTGIGITCALLVALGHVLDVEDPSAGKSRIRRIAAMARTVSALDVELLVGQSSHEVVLKRSIAEADGRHHVVAFSVGRAGAGADPLRRASPVARIAPQDTRIAAALSAARLQSSDLFGCFVDLNLGDGAPGACRRRLGRRAGRRGGR